MVGGRNCNVKLDRGMIQLGKAAKVVILTSDANLLAAQTSKYNLADLPLCWTMTITRVSVCELPLLVHFVVNLQIY
jgi:hypothetical protein